MPRERRVRRPTQPFTLATGGVSEGRPDLVALLNAREPHEALVHEAEALRRSEREARGAGRGPAAKTPASARAEARSAALAELLGDDDLAAAAALAPGSARQGQPAATAALAVPNTEPLTQPRPPSRVGILRVKELMQTARHSTMHDERQHDASRWGRLESAAFDGAFTAASAPPAASATRPASAVAAATTRGGDTTRAGGTGAPLHFVRIGVPVTALPNSGGPVLLDETGTGPLGSRPGSRSGVNMGAGAGSTQPLLSLSVTQGSGRPGGGTVGGGGLSGGVDAGLSQVSFRHATADLPPAATQTVRQMLAERRPVTVAGIHMRRPPYLDLGPPVDPSDLRDEMGPDRFGSSLRSYPAEQLAAKSELHMFKLGSAPPWQQSKSGGSYAQTFEFMAKFHGFKYYQTDFTEPRKAALRPPSAPATSSDLGPSFLFRPAEARSARLTTKAGDLDSSIRYDHPDKHVPPRRTLCLPGAHLLPYANVELLAGV